jgi:hypothetical protein
LAACEVKQLISSDEAVQAKCQHVRPCSDCPWARTALPWWLGSNTAEEWLQFAHSNTFIPCHVIDNQQCAGVAIYRANALKHVPEPLLTLPKDHEAVFSTPNQFRDHHKKS